MGQRYEGSAMDFTDDQIERYSRHILLPEVGGVGQARLLQSRVLVIGAGGLGALLMFYLAGAGVGTIGVIDDRMDSLGRAKVESAAEAVAALNPEEIGRAHV